MPQSNLFDLSRQDLISILQIEDFRAGGHVIRDENGWRENECSVDYVWVLYFNKGAFGSGGLFHLKYNENPFREYNNPEQLVKGIFSLQANGSIDSHYLEEENTSFSDFRPLINQLDLFNANKGITLGGIEYQLHLFDLNITTSIKVGNPNHPSWINLEKVIWEMGNDLAQQSKKNDLIGLFSP